MGYPTAAKAWSREALGRAHSCSRGKLRPASRVEGLGSSFTWALSSPPNHTAGRPMAPSRPPSGGILPLSVLQLWTAETISTVALLPDPQGAHAWHLEARACPGL